MRSLAPRRPTISSMRSLELPETTSALADEYGRLNDIVGSLTLDELLAPSGCRGWNNGDLLFHMLLDAQRALVAFNTPAPGPGDKDYVTYWEGFVAADDDSQAHGRFVRISAAAHRDPMQICSRWQNAADAAVTNSKALRAEFIATQGHVLAISDFVATLVVEAAIHHLDLITNLTARSDPASSALSITTATLDGLMPVSRPAHWDDETYMRKATGREALDRADLEALGQGAESIPVFS
jgi:uncharacterized protein (TIGR03083 family)